jgi:hypothetical protein
VRQLVLGLCNPSTPSSETNDAFGPADNARQRELAEEAARLPVSSDPLVLTGAERRDPLLATVPAVLAPHAFAAFGAAATAAPSGKGEPHVATPTPLDSTAQRLVELRGRLLRGALEVEQLHTRYVAALSGVRKPLLAALVAADAAAVPEAASA